MASIKIDNEELRDRGDAMDYLREIAQEIGRGYIKGPGWEFTDEPLEESTEDEEKEPETPAATDGKVLDKDGAELAINDLVAVPFEMDDGSTAEVRATVISLDDGKIKLHDFDEKIDLSEFVYDSEDVKKVDPAEEKPDPEKEDGSEPWNKK